MMMRETNKTKNYFLFLEEDSTHFQLRCLTRSWIHLINNIFSAIMLCFFVMEPSCFIWKGESNVIDLNQELFPESKMTSTRLYSCLKIYVQQATSTRLYSCLKIDVQQANFCVWSYARRLISSEKTMKERWSRLRSVNSAIKPD